MTCMRDLWRSARRSALRARVALSAILLAPLLIACGASGSPTLADRCAVLTSHLRDTLYWVDTDKLAVVGVNGSRIVPGTVDDYTTRARWRKSPGTVTGLFVAQYIDPPSPPVELVRAFASTKHVDGMTACHDAWLYADRAGFIYDEQRLNDALHRERRIVWEYPDGPRFGTRMYTLPIVSPDGRDAILYANALDKERDAAVYLHKGVDGQWRTYRQVDIPSVAFRRQPLVDSRGP